LKIGIFQFGESGVELHSRLQKLVAPSKIPKRRSNARSQAMQYIILGLIVAHASPHLTV